MILPRQDEPDGGGGALGPEAESVAPEIEAKGYNVQLDRFEGPLDLLLYLIQRDEIDIYDIPISHITEQYLASIDEIDALDLEKAGEFLVMASTLMRIKARLLLPVTREEEMDEEGDPRDELVRRLLEYKKYKEAAAALGASEEKRREYFGRFMEFPFKDRIEEEPPEFSLSMYDLLSSVKNVLDQLKGDHRHHVYQEVFTVEGQTEKILAQLEERGSLRFEEVFAESRVKMEVVVTFVAMLELMRQRQVLARQLSTYGEIWLYAGESPEPTQQQPEEQPGEEENHAS